MTKDALNGPESKQSNSSGKRLLNRKSRVHKNTELLDWQFRLPVLLG